MDLRVRWTTVLNKDVQYDYNELRVLWRDQNENPKKSVSMCVWLLLYEMRCADDYDDYAMRCLVRQRWNIRYGNRLTKYPSNRMRMYQLMSLELKRWQRSRHPLSKKVNGTVSEKPSKIYSLHHIQQTPSSGARVEPKAHHELILVMQTLGKRAAWPALQAAKMFFCICTNDCSAQTRKRLGVRPRKCDDMIL